MGGLYDRDFVFALFETMIAQLETAIEFGDEPRAAKKRILEFTPMIINSDAKKWIIREFTSLDIKSLSRQTWRAAELYDRYPAFRLQRRPPGLFERIWHSVF
jgi:hypothetical protein